MKHDLPPGVYRNDGSDQHTPAGVKEPEIKPDWKDFIALTIATYQILFVPLLAIVGGVVVSFLLLGLLFR